MDSGKVREDLQAFLKTYLIAESQRATVYEQLISEGQIERVSALLASRALADQGVTALIERLISGQSSSNL